MQQVVEPPGVRRATQAMFVVFAGVGIFATIAILGSGEGIFGLLFGTMFIGIPWIIHRASMGPGVPGFTLSNDGIMGAADDEQRLIPWGEVDRLAWRGTGLEVNGQACLALHAELVDGRSVRVTTYTARRGREVDEVEQQVLDSGLLPAGLGFGRRNEPRRDAAGAPGRADADSTPGQAQPRPTSWSDLPAGARVAVIVIGLVFVGPFLALFAFVPLLLAAFGGWIGWLVTATLIAMTAAPVVALLRRRRTPLLACSFTVEGVVADAGDGLTVPWQDGVELRVDSTVADDGPLVDGGTGRGWIVHLHRPHAGPVTLSPVLTSRLQVQRAVRELCSAKLQGLVPADVPLTLPQDLPAEIARDLMARWDGAY